MCELSIEILISCQPPKKGSCLSLWGVYMTLVLRQERFCTLGIWGRAISNFCYLFTLGQMVHKLKNLSGYMFPKNKTHIKSHISQSTVGLGFFSTTVSFEILAVNHVIISVHWVVRYALRTLFQPFTGNSYQNEICLRIIKSRKGLKSGPRL